MKNTDPRIDAYIAKAAPFAQPILKAFRAALHEAAPDTVETLRWSSPSFDVAGVPYAQMAAFKAHCRLLFWRSESLGEGRSGPELFGEVKALADLPPKGKIVAMAKKAAAARKADAATKKSPAAAKKTAPKRAAAKAPTTPADLKAALAKNKKALAAFEAFSPSHKKEYVEWISGAKREETRATRIEKCVAQCAEKKSLNWKYQ